MLPEHFNHPEDRLHVVAGAVIIALLVLFGTQQVGEWQTLAALAFLSVIALAFQRYEYAILLSMFLLPLSAARIVPREMLGVTGLNPFNIALLVAALVVVLTRVMQPARLTLPVLPRPLVLYIGVLVFATFNGVGHVAAIPPYFKALQVIAFDSPAGYVVEVFIKPLLILFTLMLVAAGVANAKNPRRFMAPLFISAVVFPLLVLADVLTSETPLSALSGGGESFSGMHVNELGLMFNMALSLALWCIFSRGSGGLRRLWLGCTIGLLTVGIALTFSRGAYLGFLTVVGYFLLRKRRFDLLLLGLLALPVAIMFMPQSVLQRASTGLGNGDVDAISAGRVNDIWRPLLPELASSPVVGQGLSSVLWSAAARTNNFFTAGRIGHPHSAYLGMLLDFGLAGAAVIVGFFLHMWRTFALLAARHPEPVWRDFFNGAGACILVLIIQGVTDDRVTPTVAQTFLWLAYGMALGFLTHVPGRAPGPGGPTSRPARIGSAAP